MALAHLAGHGRRDRPAGERRLRRWLRGGRGRRGGKRAARRRDRRRRDCRSRTRPATRRGRSTSSPSPSSGCARRAARSTRRAATRCSSGAPSASSSAARISPRRSRGSRPTRTRAPIACTRPAFARARRSRPWSRPSRRSPSNLLIGSASELTVCRDVAALGVRRVSVGGALARCAWGGFMRAAKLIAEEGRFDGFADAASGADLNALFRGGADAARAMRPSVARRAPRAASPARATRGRARRR